MDEQNALEWKKRTCCFTGHRILSREDQRRLRQELLEFLPKLISEGYCCFVAGGALGFDTIAALAVLELRDIYPHIRLRMILPCKGQETHWRTQEQERYLWILGQADEVVYLSDSYYEGCMRDRNHILVEESSCCICYLRRNPVASGTAYTVRYAEKNGLKIHNLAK